MEKPSPHRLKGKIIRIRRGLAVYQTYASPYYFAHILDPRNQRYYGCLELHLIDAVLEDVASTAYICEAVVPSRYARPMS